MNEKKLLLDILNLENKLSPENLSCDGELPWNEVKKRSAMLNKQRDTLIKQLGYEPTWEQMMKALDK